MQFTRIAIRNLRRLREPVVIEGLQPGLNVIAGDNEEGKSTVLCALRAALFDRHTLSGAAASTLQPFNSNVRPEIELGFRLGGGDYELRKAFCQKPEAELRGPGLHQTGPAAEEALRELLGFETPARGASKPEHQGLWGLLWVEQATAFQRLQHNDRSRDTLQTTLEAEVGDVLGGRQGQALLDAVAQSYQEFFTSTGRPRGDYKQAQEQVQALEEALSQLQTQLRQYDERVDRLQRLQEEAARFDSERVLPQLLQRQAAARVAAAQLEKLRAQLEAADRDLQIAGARQEGPQGRWKQRTAMRRQYEQVQEQSAPLRTAATEAGHRREQAQAALRQAEERQREAVARLETGRQVLERQQAALRLRDLQQQLVDRSARLQQAEAAEAALAKAETEAAGIGITAKLLQELRSLESRLLQAEAALQGGATQVRLALTVPVRRDGEAVAGDAEFAIAQRTELELDGVGRIALQPGGRDLAQAQAQVDQLRQALRAQLAPLQVADVHQADERLQHKQMLLQEAAAQQRLLQAHAPQGVATLRSEVQRVARELEALAADPQGEVSETTVAEARAAVAAAAKAQEAAGEAVAQARGQCEAAGSRLVEAQTLERQNQNLVKQLGESLEAARRAQTDDELYAEVTAAEQAVLAAQKALQKAGQAVEQAEPERVRLELEMADAAVQQAEEGQRRREQTIRELRIELQSLGQSGLGEQAAELAAQLVQAKARLEQLEREAGAVRLLHEVLQEAAREARETFLGPVMQRVRPYLKLLMPDAELTLDQELGLVGLRRDGVDEPFESLSVGTREQIAIVVRLAFADLLAEQGQPVAVILDDALVYADDGRLQRMQLILRRAAERFQVLLLTCRERDYLALGAPIVRLADCRVADDLLI